MFSNSIFLYLADVISEYLYFGLSGPLAGKYFMIRKVHPLRDYLKMCSSVLGYSYIVTKTAELLITDKLSPADLINPMGAYVAIKKGCTTICKGRYIAVGQ